MPTQPKIDPITLVALATTIQEDLLRICRGIEDLDGVWAKKEFYERRADLIGEVTLGEAHLATFNEKLLQEINDAKRYGHPLHGFRRRMGGH